MLIETCREAVRTAWRSVGRRPLAFAAMAVSTALGVGTMAAIVTAADRVLYRPLDVPHGARIAALYGFDEEAQRFASTSYPDYLTYQERLRTFDELAAYIRLPLRVTDGTDLLRLGAEATTANYFETFGVRSIIGTTLAGSRQSEAWPMVAVISERQWRTRLSADPSIVGRTLVAEGHPLTVVGVVADTFTSPNLGWGQRPDVWVPIEAVDTLLPAFREARVFSDRTIPSVLMIGRTADEVALDAVRAEAGVVSQSMPASGAGERPLALRIYEAGRARFWPAHRETLERSFAGFALVGALLLGLTCANLMTALGQQAMGRRSELAVRRALGAGRRELMVQTLAEGGALGIAACVLSAVVAAGVVYMLNLSPGVLGIGLSLDLGLDRQMVAACAALSFVVTIAAIAASLLVSRSGAPGAMQVAARGATTTMTWSRYALVGVQVTACAALLATTALIASSARNAADVDPGFSLDDVATVSLEASIDGAITDDAIASVAARLGTVPGIETVTRTSRLPLDPTRVAARVTSTAPNAEEVTAEYLRVDASYFEALGINLERGRAFTGVEAAEHLPVAIVSSSLAGRLWPDTGGVGEQVSVVRGTGDSVLLDVIGVAADTRYREIWNTSGLYLYTTQPDGGTEAHLVLRTREPAGPPTVAAIRRALVSLPSGLNVVGVQTGAERLGRTIEPIRSAGIFFGGLAAVAVVVALIGLHVTLGYTVQSRTREIVLRQALGATRAGSAVVVLRTPLVVAVVAVIAGACAAWMLAPLLAAQTRGLESNPVLVSLFTAAAVALACFATASISGARAARLPLARTLAGGENG